ncbi:hypothetical protein BD408DRAFT_486723 [Parasitella parasitica]|nr:hypothetical protein BD408DRAFT_486723 [Parasitella parasitica]
MSNMVTSLTGDTTKRPVMATPYFTMYKTTSSSNSNSNSNPNDAAPEAAPEAAPHSLSLPVTPRMSHSSKPQKPDMTSYDSDSSDEGVRRATLPQQGLTLRITNPDLDSDDCTTVSNVTVANDNPTAVIATNKTHWHQHQAVVDLRNRAPTLPLHKNEANLKITAIYSNPNEPHRESKTLAAAGAAAVNMRELPKNDTSRTEPIRMVPSFQDKQPDVNIPYSTSLIDTYSETSLPMSPKTSTQLATEYATNNTSKYAKVSYHLTNDPNAIKLYREMAEKTNDPTVQLMFAKYLLETANAFYPNTLTNTKAIVGSMWGLGTTTKKVQRPEPFLVAPSYSVDEEGSTPSPSNNSVTSSSRNKPISFDAANSLRSSYMDRPSTIATTLLIKQQQQHQHNERHKSDNAAMDRTRIQKRKALEDEGVNMIKKLVKQNVAEACYMQAHWMDNEMYGFKQNKAKSIQLHNIAAKENIPESVFALAEYLEGEGKVEPGVIVKYYRSAAEQGYVNAIYKMALVTLKGQLQIRQSLEKGLKLMYDACKLCTEEFNEPLFTFGLMLTNDEQGQVDVPSALSEIYGGKAAGILYYERAASLNNDKAQSKLGSIYEHGLYGESMNFARAFFHYEAGALNGNSKAMLGLCRLNNRGNHGPGDNNEAFRLENDVSGWLAATPVNEDLSFQWCEKAAKTGLVDALALLGRGARNIQISARERELLVNLMDTGPSKRELQHFLKRFGPQVRTQKPTLLSGFEPAQGAPGVKSPKEYVKELLAPTYHQLALTKVEGPFDKSDWQKVGNTLYKLQKLGLSSIVVSDNPSWRTDKSSPSELTKRMFSESMTLVETIEQAGGRARLVYNSAFERSANSGTSIDVNFDFILSALNNGQIPVVVPILTEHDGQLVPVNASEAVVALTRRLKTQALDPKLVPSKIVIINKEGGIPNHNLPGTAHSLVNVQEEFSDIESAFSRNTQWKSRYPSTMEDLAMVRDCLDQLPTSSSAIIAPTASLPSALITNLVTDKPLYSSSLPVTHHTRINQAKTTVLRHGIRINNYSHVSDLNLNRLTELLEASFQKKVNTDAFYGRLEHVLAGAIIAGDYEGAVIMTHETASNSTTQHAYLDKFAIAPSSQGIGLTDILWKRMCDGYPELLWRSRKDNGVNKWYFERSNGYLRLPNSNWVLFWHGNDGYKHVRDYSKIATRIPASFLPKE